MFKYKKPLTVEEEIHFLKQLSDKGCILGKRVIDQRTGRAGKLSSVVKHKGSCRAILRTADGWFLSVPIEFCLDGRIKKG